MAGRRPGAFIDDEDEEDQDEVLAAMKQERMRMMMRDGDGEVPEDDGMENLLDFEDVQGPLSVWLKKTDVVKFIYRQFN